MPHNLSPAVLDARLEALETRLAYQEDWLDTLDRAVIEQQRRLDALENISTLMRKRLRELGHARSDETDTPNPAHEIPPHY